MNLYEFLANLTFWQWLGLLILVLAFRPVRVDARKVSQINNDNERA